jgi:hypothetical protein
MTELKKHLSIFTSLSYQLFNYPKSEYEQPQTC